MVISIRRSRHEEGEELVAIWCRSVDATHDFLSAEYRAELEELVRSFLPEAPLWVAVNERDRLVGFMLLSGQHMDALFVDPDARGCGVGRMLVEHALSMAPELTTNVNEQNKQAVGFYKKMGFKVTGRSEVDDLGKPYPLLNLAYVGNKLPPIVLSCLRKLEQTRQRRSLAVFCTSAKGHPDGWPSAKFDAWQFPTLAWGDPTLPSALRRFTSEFGMGSGGTTALRPPGKFCLSDRFCVLI